MAIKRMVDNEKGGVAKTTTAVELAVKLSVEQNRRVLLIDLDQQGNATERLCEASAPKCRVIDWMTRDDLKSSDVLTKSKFSDNLYIIAASKAQGGLSEANFDPIDHPDPKTVLRDKLMPFDKAFQDIVFDCSASLNFLTQSAFRVCDQLIVPTELTIAGKNAAMTMFRMYTNLQKAGYPLKEFFVLICNYEKPHLAETKRVFKLFQDTFGDNLIETKIYSRHEVEKAINNYSTISMENKNHIVSKQYRKFANDVLSQ